MPCLHESRQIQRTCFDDKDVFAGPAVYYRVISSLPWHVVYLLRLQLNDEWSDDLHSRRCLTDAWQAGCQMLIIWWVFFFCRNVPIGVISDYAACYCSLLKLLLISFITEWKTHCTFLSESCEISGWGQMAKFTDLTVFGFLYSF